MSKLRVISGTSKGRRLRSVPGNSTRPITDRVKTSLFNILGQDIIGSTMLDLFAGTGSVGIEALSRGADYVLFIDNNHQAINTIKYNLEITSLKKSAEVIKSDALTQIKKIPTRKFDYIYIAPPQYKGLWMKSLIVIDREHHWLSKDGWIIVQIHPTEYQTMDMVNFTEFEQRRYGSTLLVFYQVNSRIRG
jgi:16S rRNA (guanine(966)-N(2))-methyltransferase RsmD